jgi:hypothetical protein
MDQLERKNHLLAGNSNQHKNAVFVPWHEFESHSALSKLP